MESAEAKAKAKRTKACYISSLPHHLIKLIFCKLPVSSLTHACRYVCKLWQQILMDPDFAKFHLAMRKPTDLFLCTERYRKNLYWLEFHGESRYFNVVANLDFKSIDLINSCNGLVLVCQHSKVLHVINPITCEYVSCPPCEKGMRLITGLCGFGFDPKTDKFKVLRCVSGGTVFDRLQFEVCTLGNGTWRSIMDLPRFHPSWSSFDDACVNGSLHFIARVEEESHRIWAIDFVCEQFKSMLLPPVFNDDNRGYHWLNIAVARDSIYVICFADPNPNHMEVWLMKEYGVFESWTKMFAIDCQLNFDYLYLFGRYVKIKVLENGGCLLYNCPDLFLCNPETSPIKIETQGFHTGCPIAHHPSFVSLKDIAGERSKVLDARARRGTKATTTSSMD